MHVLLLFWAFSGVSIYSSKLSHLMISYINFLLFKFRGLITF